MRDFPIPPDLMERATVRTVAGEAKGGPKRSKYRAVRTEYNGVMYDSRFEAARAAELDALQANGVIRWWLAKPKFRLGLAENIYVADALVIDHLGEWAEDTKGVDTPKFLRDVKLWRRFGPCELHIVRRSGATIIPGGRMVATVRKATEKDVR